MNIGQIVSFAPVVITAYGRADVICQTLLRLLRCSGIDQTDVYLFMDAPAHDENNVRDAQNACMRFKKDMFPQLNIIVREVNMGAKDNIVASVSEIISRYGRAIVLDEDVLVSSTFLCYMNQALEVYRNDMRIWGVSAYKHPFLKIPSSYQHDVFLFPRSPAWGWGTWVDRWNNIDFDIKNFDEINAPAQIDRFNQYGADMFSMLKAQHEGKIDTWDIQCSYYMAMNDLYTVRPVINMVKNNGFTKQGRHCSQYNPIFARQKYYNFDPKLDARVVPDVQILQQMKCLQTTSNLWMRLYRYIFKHVMYCSPVHLAPIDI